MATNDAEGPQGPFEGSRCVAGPGGAWGPATLRRVNEDGTFKVEMDVKEMILMPYWHGVTPGEVSFDDPRLWPAVFAQLSRDGRTFALLDFAAALGRLGFAVDAEQAQQFWTTGCQHLFNVSPEQADGFVLDENSAYRLFLHLRVSAKQCALTLQPGLPRPYFKLYWNQTRMGGREPSDLCRPVTLADAFAALGVTRGGVDASAAAFLQEQERRHGLRFPAALKDFFCREGIAEAVVDCHPNNPRLVPLDEGPWDLQRGMRQQQLQGDYAVTIMIPHQGDHEWAAVFDDGDADARVYVRWHNEEGEGWLLTAPGIGMFFWDLAQTGLAWYQDTRFEGGKAVRRTEIGLEPDC